MPRNRLNAIAASTIYAGPTAPSSSLYSARSNPPSTGAPSVSTTNTVGVWARWASPTSTVNDDLPVPAAAERPLAKPVTAFSKTTPVAETARLLPVQRRRLTGAPSR